MNTKFLEAEFDYVKPATLCEALDTLANKQNVKIFAGGTDLIVKLKTGAPIQMDIMMDINAVEELKGVKKCDCGCTMIGAAEKISVLEKDALLNESYPALTEAFRAMASISVRNMATLGGNFCNASPVADPVGPVMCYGGSVELKSAKGSRQVAAEDFFLAPGVTVMEKDEMLTGICLPAPVANTGAAFIKIGRVKSDIAKISICAVIVRDGDKIVSCRMSMGSVAARPLFLKDIGESLAGKVMTNELILETAQQISAFIKPITDTRTTAEYRTDMAAIIARDVLQAAWKNSGGACK